MSSVENHVGADVLASLDSFAAIESEKSNCMFQLALMVARMAVEPGPEAFKEEAVQTLMGLIRAKPKINVVRLFSDRPKAAAPVSGLRDTG